MKNYNLIILLMLFLVKFFKAKLFINKNKYFFIINKKTLAFIELNFFYIISSYSYKIFSPSLDTVAKIY